jgi:3-deoxy-7-phosphoheptulonate synthase
MTMIVSLRPGADPGRVKAELVARGLWVELFDGGEGASRRTFFVVEPWSRRVSPDEVAGIEGVETVSARRSPHPLVDAQGLRVPFGPVVLGDEPLLVSGPCSVESEAQIHRIALALSKMGVRFLRGGAFKPRTSPYSFQGRGTPALEWMRSAASAAGLGVVTEVLGENDVDAVAEYADVLQIGSRTMQSFSLLKAVGASKKPVLLKRGMSSTVEEWLLAGEYLLKNGAASVVFCERGIRSFDPTTRNLLDLGAVALLRHAHGLPVIVDPSHAVGRRDLVAPLAHAALAAGAVGVMIESHDDPGRALSDGPQALSLEQMAELAASLRGPASAPVAPRRATSLEERAS